MRNLLNKSRMVYTNLNIKLGQSLYGNIANFSNNFNGRARWNASKKKFKTPISVNDNASELQRNGVAFFKSGFPKELVAQVYKEYLSVIENEELCHFFDDKAKVVGKNEGKYRTIIANPFESVPSIKALFTEDLVNFLRQYYESEFQFYGANLWRNKHISEEHLERIYPDQPYSILWHVDGDPVDTLKMFMVLSDVTEEDGPFYCLTEARTQEVRKSGYFNRFKYNMPKDEIENPDYVRKLIGPSGTTVFCNATKCLHRAGVPAEGRFRDILEFQFESSTVPFKIPTKNVNNHQY